MRLSFLLKSIQMADHEPKTFGSWGGLKIIAIGPMGGKIVGYGADGKPYYAGSPGAKALAALKGHPDAGHKLPEQTPEQSVAGWLQALGFPCVADKGIVTVSQATGEMLQEHFKATAQTKSPKAWHFSTAALAQHVGEPLKPKTNEEHVTWAASMASDKADGSDGFPDLATLKQADDAGKYAGSHGNQLFVDPSGKKFIFKAADPTISRAEEAAARIGRLILGDKVAPAKFVKLGGKSGVLIGEVAGHALNESNHSEPPQAALKEHFDDVIQHHIVDWLTSNHDGHAGNFLSSDGALNAIDKGQSWRFFGKDKLDHNVKHNASWPIYKKFWDGVQSGKLKGDMVAAAAKALDMADKITPEQFEAIITPYVLTAAGKQGFDPKVRIAQMVARLTNLRADYEKFLSGIVGQKVTVPGESKDNFETMPEAKVEPGKPKLVEPDAPKVIAETPKPVVAQPAPGWPVKKGKLTVHHPGDAPPPGVKWPKGAPGDGFKMEADYKGQKYEIKFENVNGEFVALVMFPDGTLKQFDSPNKASDSLYLFHNKLPLDMNSTDKKKAGISYPAAKAFGFLTFADELAAASGQPKTPDEMSVKELETAKIVTPEQISAPAAPEPVAPSENNFETMPEPKEGDEVTPGTITQGMVTLENLPLGATIDNVNEDVTIQVLSPTLVEITSSGETKTVTFQAAGHVMYGETWKVQLAPKAKNITNTPLGVALASGDPLPETLYDTFGAIPNGKWTTLGAEETAKMPVDMLMTSSLLQTEGTVVKIGKATMQKVGEDSWIIMRAANGMKFNAGDTIHLKQLEAMHAILDTVKALGMTLHIQTPPPKAATPVSTKGPLQIILENGPPHHDAVMVDSEAASTLGKLSPSFFTSVLNNYPNGHFVKLGALSAKKTGENTFTLLNDQEGNSVKKTHLSAVQMAAMLQGVAKTSDQEYSVWKLPDTAPTTSGKELTQIDPSKISAANFENIVDAAPMGTKFQIGSETWTKMPPSGIMAGGPEGDAYASSDHAVAAMTAFANSSGAKVQVEQPAVVTAPPQLADVTAPPQSGKLLTQFHVWDMSESQLSATLNSLPVGSELKVGTETWAKVSDLKFKNGYGGLMDLTTTTGTLKHVHQDKTVEVTQPITAPGQSGTQVFKPNKMNNAALEEGLKWAKVGSVVSFDDPDVPAYVKTDAGWEKIGSTLNSTFSSIEIADFAHAGQQVATITDGGPVENEPKPGSKVIKPVDKYDPAVLDALVLSKLGTTVSMAPGQPTFTKTDKGWLSSDNVLGNTFYSDSEVGAIAYTFNETTFTEGPEPEKPAKVVKTKTDSVKLHTSFPAFSAEAKAKFDAAGIDFSGVEKQAIEWSTEEKGGKIQGAKPSNWPGWVPPTGVIVEATIAGKQYFLVTSVAGHTPSGEAGGVCFALLNGTDGTVHNTMKVSPKEAISALEGVAKAAGLELGGAAVKKLFGLDKAVFAPGETLLSIKGVQPPSPVAAPKEKKPKVKKIQSANNFQTMPESTSNAQPGMAPAKAQKAAKSQAQVEKEQKAQQVKDWSLATKQVENAAHLEALGTLQDVYSGPMWARVAEDGSILIGSPGSEFPDFVKHNFQGMGTEVETPLGKFIALKPGELLKIAGVGLPVVGADGKTYPHGTTFESVETKYTIEQLLAQEAGFYKLKAHDTDPNTMVLKIQGNGIDQIQQMKDMLTKWDVKTPQAANPIVGKSRVLAFISKSELARIGKTETNVIPHIPKQPPPFVPASIPGIAGTSLDGHEALNNRGDLAVLDTLHIGKFGNTIRMGKAGVFRNGQISVRKVKKGNKVFYEFSGALNTFQNTGSLSSGEASFKTAMGTDDAGKLAHKFDPTTGTHTESESGGNSGTFKGYSGSTGGGSSINIVTQANAFKNIFTVRVPADANVESELSDAFSKMGLNTTDAMSMPDEKDERMLIKAQIVRGMMGAPGFGANMLSQAQLSDEAFLDTKLAEFKVSKSAVASAKLQTVFGGTQAVVLDDADKWQDVNFVYQGQTSWEGVFYQLRDGLGWSSRVKRYLTGVVNGGASAATDVSTGGALASFSRIADSTRRDSGPWGYHCEGIKVIFHPRVMQRADWFAHNFDHCGNTSDGTGSGRYKELSSSTLDQNNEICHESGLSVHDAVGVAVTTSAERTKLINALKAEGMDDVNGIPLEKFVVIQQNGSRSDLAKKLVGLQQGVLP